MTTSVLRHMFFALIVQSISAAVGLAQSSSQSTLINLKDVGAKGDGSTDDQTALVSAFTRAALAPGTTVYAPPGVYRHSGTLPLNGFILVGDGPATTTFEATNPLNSAIILQGESPRISGMTLKSDIGKTGRSSSDNSTMVAIEHATHFSADHLVITSGASAGIMNRGGTGTPDSWARIAYNRISGTLADGIHNTDQAHYILVTSNTVSNNGDDMVAVVSYRKDAAKCSDIDISSNVVSGNYWGRGITVVGGDRVHVWNNTVSNTAGAGLYFASEGFYDTYGDDGVVADHNEVTHACVAPCSSAQAGVHVIGRKDFPITTLRIEHNTIRDSTRDGIYLGGSVIDPVILDNVIDGWGRMSIEVYGATGVQLVGNQISPIGTSPGNTPPNFIIHSSSIAPVAVRVFPNPWRARQSYRKQIFFSPVPEGSYVTIDTISGYEIQTLSASGSRVIWDLTTRTGQDVASGVYLYTVKEPDGSFFRGKIAVIR